MNFFPASICLKDRLCIVVGAGEVAERKIKALLQAGAKVKVIAPDADKFDGVESVARKFKKGDLRGAFLVMAATGDKGANQQIYREAFENNILINIADEPKFCNFYVPSVINRGRFQVAISTSGAYPALSKKTRKNLEKEFGHEYELYLDLLAEARKKIIEKYGNEERRSKLNGILNDKDIMKLIKEDKLVEAKGRINRWI